MTMRIMIVTMSCLLSGANAFAYGALAIDSGQGSQYGFSYNYPSLSAAQDEAIRQCGYGCSVVQTFSGGCAAYAADQSYGSTAWGWGKSGNAGGAQQLALDYCRNRGGSMCIVRVWGCDSG